ncbi:MAG: hypothetical protein U0L26_06395 [Cellulosilyticum sp.]|nr:hypothetical protein [Cellulosilyticum sp.]
MKLIKEERSQVGWQWKLYDYSLGKCECKITFQHLDASYIQTLLKDYEIELAILDFEMNNIDFLYETIPRIQIVINPYSIYQVVEHSFDVVSSWQEEVAITIEKSIRREKEEVDHFLKWFYQASSTEEAYKRYEKWQQEHLMNDILGNKLIDLLQLYEEEVFNYFKYSSILALI